MGKLPLVEQTARKGRRVRQTAAARSLRADLLVAAVVPLVILSLGAAAIIYTLSRVQLEARVTTQLDTVASFLIGEAELALLTQAPDLLREPVLRALSDEDIVHVSVYSADGELVFEEGISMGPDIPHVELITTQSGPEHRKQGSQLYELRRVVRYHEEPGAELLGFVNDPGAGQRAPLGEPQGYVRVVMSSASVVAGYRRLLLSSGAAMGVVLIVGSGLALALARRPVRCMSLLSTAVREVGSSSLDVEVPDLGGGEIAELGRAFNDMSARLQTAQAEIAEHQNQLERKVDERTAELNLMRITAERASQAKTHFLANMSHEIRTPMTAIRGYTDVLMEDSTIGDDQRESLEIIKRNGDHLLALINGILDLSKVEAGHMQVEREPVDLVQLLVEVARALRVRADEREIELRVEFRGRIPTLVVSDAVRIRQAVINLLGNAIKFTNEGSVVVRLYYDEARSTARVEVVDTGIGVEPDRIPCLFHQFEQADTSTSRQFGGTGLGLAITQRLAALLDGDCTMESEVGVGTTVALTFRAPLAENAEIREVSEEAKQLRRDTPAEAGREQRLEARILLAEDGTDNQRLISMILRKAGAQVEIAENGRIAVDTLSSDDAFDLVLMDMAMPEMDGYTATRTLREMGFELPIVALTAHAMDGEREKCIEAGCDDYTTKPIDKGVLLGILKTALEKRAGKSPPFRGR